MAYLFSGCSLNRLFWTAAVLASATGDLCLRGLNAVKAALRLDQMKWEKNEEEKSSKRRKRDAKNPDPEYLRSRFGTSDFPVFEVVRGLENFSPDPRAADLQIYAATCLQVQGVQSHPICAQVQDLLEISMVRISLLHLFQRKTCCIFSHARFFLHFPKQLLFASFKVRESVYTSSKKVLYFINIILQSFSNSQLPRQP